MLRYNIHSLSFVQGYHIAFRCDAMPLTSINQIHNPSSHPISSHQFNQLSSHTISSHLSLSYHKPLHLTLVGTLHGLPPFPLPCPSPSFPPSFRRPTTSPISLSSTQLIFLLLFIIISFSLL